MKYPLPDRFSLTILCLLLLLTAAKAQIETKPLTGFSPGAVLQNGFLWEANTIGLLKRDAQTGAILGTYALPIQAHSLNSIVAAPDGAIWIGMENGLARFDGASSWQIWNMLNTPVFGQDRGFKVLGFSADGTLWATREGNSSDQRTYRFENGSWQIEAALDGLGIHHLANGPQGELVLCGRDTLLQKQGSWQPIPKPVKYLFNAAVAFDQQGKLWVTANHSDFYRYNNLSQLPLLFTQISDYGVNTLVFDAQNNLWIDSEGLGLGRFETTPPYEWTFFNSIAGSNAKTPMTNLCYDTSADRFWITQRDGSSSTMLTLWSNGAPVRNFHAGLPDAGIIGHDGNHNMWFAGPSSTVVRQKASDGTLDYFELDSLGVGEFYYYAKIRPGTGEEVWIFDYGVRHFDGQHWSNFPLPFPPEYVEDLVEDDAGHLFLALGGDPDGTFSPIRIYDLNTGAWSTVDCSVLGLFSARITSLAIDDDNNLWFSCDQGVGQRSADGTMELFSIPGWNNWGGSEAEVQVTPDGRVFAMVGPGNTPSTLSRYENGSFVAIPWPNNYGFNFPSPYFQWHVNAAGQVWVYEGDPEFTEHFVCLLWEAGVWQDVSQWFPGPASSFGSDGLATTYMGFYYDLGKFKPRGRVEGDVQRALNGNCQAGGESMAHIAVVGEKNGHQNLALSQEDGSYRLFATENDVQVKAIPPNYLWASCDPDGIPVTVSADAPVALDLRLQALVNCPRLDISLATLQLRRCSTNTYYARICNTGTAIAENAYVDIALPQEMTLLDATLAPVQIMPQVWRFLLGDVAMGSCMEFRMSLFVDCDHTVLNQTLCVVATVHPDSICAPPNSGWNGATVLLDAQCDGDSVRFTLTNTGTAATAPALPYKLLRNLNTEATGSFGLSPGESRSIGAAATGETWRLFAAQQPNHPFLPMTPSLAVEGCKASGGFGTRGLVTDFPSSNGSAFQLQYCEEVIGAYDPNDKSSLPVGAGEALHLIAPGTSLEYRIRFQNTGTDTAFTVIVRDTLDRGLDFGSFEAGVASHPYRVEAEGNVLSFIFENILLPDSNANELASHGFVDFRLRPRADLPLGSAIFNRAGIFFNLNKAVVTNTVWHVVDTSFQVVGTSGPFGVAAIPQLQVFPNPAREQFWVNIPIMVRRGSLEAFDAQGRRVVHLKEIDAGVPVILVCRGWAAGLYALRFTGADGRILYGKVVVDGR